MGRSGPEERFGEPPLWVFPDCAPEAGAYANLLCRAQKHLKRGFEEFLILTPKKGALTAAGIK